MEIKKDSLEKRYAKLKLYLRCPNIDCATEFLVKGNEIMSYPPARIYESERVIGCKCPNCDYIAYKKFSYFKKAGLVDIYSYIDRNRSAIYGANVVNAPKKLNDSHL